MALKSPDAAAEMFLGDESSLESLPLEKPANRGMALTNRAIVGSVKGAGKALKIGGSGFSKLVRAGWRNKRDLGMIGATAAITASAMAPEQAVDVSKSVVSGSMDAIHNPKGAAGSATTETEKALLDAADAAVSKARQGMELAGEKFDLSGTRSHGIPSAPENQEKKLESIEREIDYFYPGTSGAGRDQLYNEINVTRVYMEGILTPDSYNNLRDNLQVLDNIYKVTGIRQSAMGGLACAESRAGVDGGLDQLPVEVNEEVAAAILRGKPLGPVQLSGDFDQSLNVTGKANDDRLKWEKALPSAAEEIFKSTIYFSGKNGKQGMGLAFWRMHMGRNGIKQLIEAYSANHGLAYTNLEDFVNKEKITPFKILEIKNIREQLEQPGYDRTPIYVLRIAACASIIDDLESEWRKQLSSKIETVVDSAKIIKFPQKARDKAA